MQIICLVHYFCSFHSAPLCLSLLICLSINLHSHDEREAEEEMWRQRHHPAHSCQRWAHFYLKCFPISPLPHELRNHVTLEQVLFQGEHFLWTARNQTNQHLLWRGDFNLLLLLLLLFALACTGVTFALVNHRLSSKVKASANKRKSKK